MIEFALILLPLVMVTFGAIDLGRAFIFIDKLHGAAQAGALFARANPSYVTAASGTCAGSNNISYQVANEQSAPPGSGSLGSLGYTVTVSDLGPAATTSATTTTIITGCGAVAVAAGELVSVQVSSQFSLITPILSGLLGTLTLHGTVQVVTL
ncbi:MAG: TadE/TadG family type IV pilus assembly protein [Solirubrobacteraceae bacterium]